jgi:hypothetical protein
MILNHRQEVCTSPPTRSASAETVVSPPGRIQVPQPWKNGYAGVTPSTLADPSPSRASAGCPHSSSWDARRAPDVRRDPSIMPARVHVTARIEILKVCVV